MSSEINWTNGLFLLLSSFILFWKEIRRLSSMSTNRVDTNFFFRRIIKVCWLSNPWAGNASHSSADRVEVKRSDKNVKQQQTTNARETVLTEGAVTATVHINIKTNQIVYNECELRRKHTKRTNNNNILIMEDITNHSENIGLHQNLLKLKNMILPL